MNWKISLDKKSPLLRDVWEKELAMDIENSEWYKKFKMTRLGSWLTRNEPVATNLERSQ